MSRSLSLRCRSGLALLVVAAAASGCAQAGGGTSTDDFQGEERAVAQVVEDLQAAGEGKDAAKICRDILAPDLRTQLDQAGSSCPDEMERAIEDADDFDLVVQDVTVTGDDAKATITRRSGQKQQTAIFEFAKLGGRWRATSLAAGA